MEISTGKSIKRDFGKMKQEASLMLGFTLNMCLYLVDMGRY
jgi:hypothetical protein